MSSIQLKIPLLLFLLLTIVIHSNAQASKRSNIWYFGEWAGLDFNSGSPVPLMDGKVDNWEGCASICSENGDLLVYTDGIKVWNRDHAVIPGANNLHGNNSSTQSGIIVPDPADENRYYIFTVDAEGGPRGIKHTLIDMTMNGGLGGVVSANIPMFNASTEKITAIPHCNKVDWWIIGHRKNSRKFLIWELTAAGLSAMTLTGDIGSLHGGGTTNTIGYLKSAPNGSKLALAVYGSQYFELFDFDDQTGTISNPIKFNNALFDNPYAVEFSPNGERLYLAGTQNTPRLFQLDLTLATPVDIQNSLTLISTGTSSYFGAIQNGPDGKIYVAKDNHPSLSVIGQPNELGAACTFIEDALILGGRNSRLGLPNLIPSFFETQVQVNIDVNPDVCLAQALLTAGTDLVPTGQLSYQWFYEDSAISGATDTFLQVTNSGEYTFVIYEAAICSSPVEYDAQIVVDLSGLLEVAQMTITDISCQQINGWIEIEVGGGSAPYEFSMDNGNSFTTAQVSPQYSFTGLGEGCYSLIIRDDNNCELGDSACVQSTIFTDITLVNAESCHPSDTGTTQVILTGQAGCDSIITTTTSLLENDSLTVYQTSCDLMQVGNAVDTFLNAQGCDSVVTVVTSFLESDTLTVFQTSCDPLQVGSLTDTLQNDNGCDSLVTTITALQTSDLTIINQTSCDPMQIGSLVDSLFDVNGCDSVVTTITSFLESDTLTIYLSSCDPLQVGSITDTLQNNNGCDSLVTTITALQTSDLTTINQTSCDPMQIGSQVDSLFDVNGCDSVVTTITSFLESDTLTIYLSSCDPLQVGSFTDTLQNNIGCDSLVTTITALQTSDLTTINQTSCDPMQIGSQVDSLFNVNGCDSVVTIITSFLEKDTLTLFETSCDISEVGSITDTLMNNLGCDSLVTTLTSYLNADMLTIAQTSCDPLLVGTMVDTLLNVNGCDSIVTVLTSLVLGDTLTLYSSTCDSLLIGISVDSLNNVNGCDSLVTHVVQLEAILPFQVVPDHIIVPIGASVELNILGPAGDYSWSPPTFLSCSNCMNSTATPMEDIVYTVQLGEGTCIQFDTVVIDVMEENIFMPSAFTPNGDGINDLLFVIDQNIEELHTFRIYNRWGELVFDTADLSKGWDGQYKGQAQNIDTYTYYLSATMLSGTPVVLTGSFFLVR